MKITETFKVGENEVTFTLVASNTKVEVCGPDATHYSDMWEFVPTPMMSQRRLKECVMNILISEFGVIGSDNAKRKLYYGNSSRIARLLHYLCLKQFLIHHNMSKEEYLRLTGLLSKVTRSNSYVSAVDYGIKVLMRHRRDNWDLYYTIMCDMSKYSPLVSKFILETLAEVKQEDIMSKDEYFVKFKRCPKVALKCKYYLPSVPKEEFFKQHGYPTDRFGWFVSCIVSPYSSDSCYMQNRRGVGAKFIKMKIRAWHYYRDNVMRAPGTHYSLIRIGMMITYVLDGMSIYDRLHINTDGIDFQEVEGSPMKMLRAAHYNHNQETRISREELLKTPCVDMPAPPIDLPSWIEDMRLKTTHELAIAGSECRNCIAGYTWSEDIFVRQDNICAQIRKTDLKVVQCFDYRNTTTKRSIELAGKLKRTVKPLIKYLPERVVQEVGLY